MSTPREELHALIDELPDEAVAEFAPDMREILKHRLELRRRRATEPRPWPPSWFGAGAGSRPDIARQSEDILRDEFGRHE